MKKATTRFADGGLNPPAANVLPRFVAAVDTGMSELVAERHVWVLNRVLTDDVVLTDKEGPAVKTSRVRKGNHNVGIVSGIEWRGPTRGHRSLFSDRPRSKAGIRNGAYPAR